MPFCAMLLWTLQSFHYFIQTLLLLAIHLKIFSKKIMIIVFYAEKIMFSRLDHLERDRVWSNFLTVFSLKTLSDILQITNIHMSLQHR